MNEQIPGHFKPIRKIGEGGMAIIYLVLDKRDDKKYAIKILNANKKDSHADKKRFKQEIEITKKIDSPKIVKVYDYKWNDDIQYILMEYVEGRTLKDYLSIKKRLTPDEAVDICSQLSEGFFAIHNSGIIHRDIKSSNIMISNHGIVKIIDFGIAISNDSERFTKIDKIIASPHYLAPELIDLEDPSEQSDVYSLGILLYEMIMGEIPYKEKAANLILNMHKYKDVPHVNKTFYNIPQSLSNVIIKATSRNKNKRHKDMKELYKDLDTCLHISRAYEEVYSLREKKKKTLINFINSNRFWIFFFLLLVIILIILISLLLMEGI